MKVTNFKRKLELNKSTIANLSANAMSGIFGGADCPPPTARDGMGNCVNYPAETTSCTAGDTGDYTTIPIGIPGFTTYTVTY